MSTKRPDIFQYFYYVVLYDVFFSARKKDRAAVLAEKRSALWSKFQYCSIAVTT